MIDPKLLRTDPDLVRRSQETHRDSVEPANELVSANEARRSGIATYDRLRAEQGELGRLIPKTQGNERTELLTRTKQFTADVKAAQEQSEAAREYFNELIIQLENIVIDGVPHGGEDDGLMIEIVGVPRGFAAKGFGPGGHLRLGEALGAIDMKRGTKISESWFYVLTGIGARLEFALLNLTMAKAVEWGFTATIPPALVKLEVIAGTDFLGQAAKDVYHLSTDDLYLVGISEMILAAFHSDEIPDTDSLPRHYAAFSPCFRREADSYGKNTHSIFRVHWFDKVRMFIHCLPGDAENWHQRLLGFEKGSLQTLEIPFQVLDVASGDLGLSTTRKYGCYAWLPARQHYREVASTSNYTQFQARHFGIRHHAEKDTERVAALNGILCTMTWIIIALLENHQRADGSMHAPEALRPHLGGLEVLTAG